MKMTSILSGWAPTLFLTASTASAVTFTNDGVISPNDSRFEGAALVVSNCTLVVDGPHLFSSVHVLNGGRITHSVADNGFLADPVSILDERHILTSTNAEVLTRSNVVIATVLVRDAAGLSFYLEGLDYTIGASNEFTTISRTPDSLIPDGAEVRVDYEVLDDPIPAAVNIIVSNDVTVEPGARIGADGTGSVAGLGLGRSAGNPRTGTGASHGGFGGAGSSNAPTGNVYGSMSAPTNQGSAGGPGSGGSGGRGGGAVKLAVGGTLRIDGFITANGANATNTRAGGGSGGSVWLAARTIAGTGRISADGGAGEPIHGGGGGGGRIAIYATTNVFAGNQSARGGLGFVAGGAGTIYTKLYSQSVGQVTVDNGGRAGTNTLVSVTDGSDLTIQGRALVSLSTAANVGRLYIGSNSWIRASSNVDLVVSASRSVLIDATGGILADGLGYPGGLGPGAGVVSNFSGTIGSVGGGGGHGGSGGLGGRGGNPYGLAFNPSLRGSGGGSGSPYIAGFGGAGGGLIHLTSQGPIVLNGTVSANGGGPPSLSGASQNLNGGGGSGGTVLINSPSLSGSGLLAANGAAGDNLGGSGGGGRIAVLVLTNAFSGSATAYGGSGSSPGGAGTIYMTGAQRSLLVDNGSRAGGITAVEYSSMFNGDLMVAGKASLVWPVSGLSPVRNLSLTSGGSIRITNGIQVVNSVSASNILVQAGSAFIADGAGSLSGFNPTGPGVGRNATTTTSGAGGGGHGGMGASGAGLTGGGASYESYSSPTLPGSSGGYAVNPVTSPGGAGGGAISLSATTLQLEGKISANGSAGAGTNSGGGSGGTIVLSAGTISGAGLLSANGGAGALPLGGGGGAGRIVVNCSTNNFVGLATAFGGGGFARGGAGTILFAPTKGRLGNPRIIVDNGGVVGTNTLLAATGFIESYMGDLTVSGGAALVWPGGSFFTLGNLLIGSNSAVLFTNSVAVTLSVTNQALVQAGGKLSTDGAGYQVGRGQQSQGAGRSGTSQSSGGSGGGYGGAGGAGLGTIGGAGFGLLVQPQDRGSGGGNGYLQNVGGGAGGGALRLSSKNLQLDGTLSANGYPAGGTNSGGGSGGSLWITAGTISGVGTLSANGGSGQGVGGGGGGGRIALGVTTNRFVGTISAFGGTGYGNGGAGTIYLSISNQLTASVIVDNGGRPGTNTSFGTFASNNPLDLTIGGGGALVLSGAQTFQSVVIGRDSWVVLTNVSTISVRSNVTIAAGGGITGNGAVNLARSGQGNGGTIYITPYGTTGGGGGHGGYGSVSLVGASAGMAFDSVNSPVLPGGWGGGSPAYGVASGVGGGALRLTITGFLVNDGILTVDGGDAVTTHAGGGAGGSLLVQANRISGTGRFSANGGKGNGVGGSGGGGRIALVCNSNLFTGVLEARGGGGTNYGGAGTIYLPLGFIPPSMLGQRQATGLIVDNGGNAGAATLIEGNPLSGGADYLTVRGAGMATWSSSLQFFNVLVASNSFLVFSNQAAQVGTVRSDLIVERTGGIIADGTGQTSTGIGYSTSTGVAKGGGGHGGFGGGNPVGWGITYDSIESPSTAGSPGGGFIGGINVPGGGGGGIIRMTVSGQLNNEGRVSANGLAGVQNSGGGSGGSIALKVGRLSGTGVIAANGGAGGIQGGGGGGGGRISIRYDTNNFSGLMSAFGGVADNAGGAGTIYLKDSRETTAKLLVQNGGVFGTNTPVTLSGNYDVLVSGGAVLQAPRTSQIVNSLTVADAGLLTGETMAPLEVTVFKDLMVAPDSAISVSGLGYAQSSGPGRGIGLSGFGSGGGYGGVGGASATGVPGGSVYGSLTEPLDLGSGGGPGAGPNYDGGSLGAGAIRLRIGGMLTVDGWISADGYDGFQDNSGGGAGGSVWITSRSVRGDGSITADGGFGEFFGGGGGGGGRIAVYSPSNGFGGTFSVRGGEGASRGGDGTTFLSSNLPAFQVVSHTLTSVLSNGPGPIELTFSAPINLDTYSSDDFALTVPGGALGSTSFVVTSPARDQITVIPNVPPVPGDYLFRVGPDIEDMFGQAMSQVYTGAFTVTSPVIQGRVTDTNGLPLSGITVLLNDGSGSSVTDSNGVYSLEFPPMAFFTVAPTNSAMQFVPGVRYYSGVGLSLTNQDFLAVSSLAPALAMDRGSTNPVLKWHAIPGVQYWIYESTNLIYWRQWEYPVIGSNGIVRFPLPVSNEPMKYFRVGAQN